MANDVPNYQGESLPVGWKTVFHTMGWLACILNGRVGRYAYYVTQAEVEQGGSDLNGWTARECNNPFAMHVSEYTSRADDGVPGDGGTMAVYSSWTDPFLFNMVSLYRAWKDRFAWDDAQVPRQKLDFNEWSTVVAMHGYAGGAAATPAQRAAYKAALIAQWNRTDNATSLARWISDDDFVNDSEWMKGLRKFIKVVMLFFVVVIILWLLWWLYRLFAWLFGQQVKRPGILNSRRNRKARRNRKKLWKKERRRR